jgi:hypothetical protein
MAIRLAWIRAAAPIYAIRSKPVNGQTEPTRWRMAAIATTQPTGEKWQSIAQTSLERIRSGSARASS